MAFFVSLSEKEMARQIAALINTHNRLYRRRTERYIMSDKSDYFVEIVLNSVVGCAGLSQRDTNLSEIKHVCVHPSFRQKGIGKKLVSLAMANCPTDLVYMTIREDNTPSLKMASSLGFNFVRKHWNIDHHVITVGRYAKDASRGAESG